jgi:hypothetical protein
VAGGNSPVGGRRELPAGGRRELPAGGRRELPVGGGRELPVGGRRELPVGSSRVSSEHPLVFPISARCRWHRLIAASTSSSAPRSCHDPSRRTVADLRQPLEHLVDGLGLRMDATREPNRPRTATALIDGPTGLSAVVCYGLRPGRRPIPAIITGVTTRRSSA